MTSTDIAERRKPKTKLQLNSKHTCFEEDVSHVACRYVFEISFQKREIHLESTVNTSVMEDPRSRQR